MRITWDEIYNNGENSSAQFFESTYRAKVFGGWLIRHETCSDYQYADATFESSSHHKYVDEEGFQNISNTITFMLDPEHKWDIEEEVQE